MEWLSTGVGPSVLFRNVITLRTEEISSKSNLLVRISVSGRQSVLGVESSANAELAPDRCSNLRRHVLATVARRIADVIERGRILWLTLIATVGAAIAAVFGFFTLLLDLCKSLVTR